MNKYKSCALWSKTGKTTDTHDTEKMAKGVCWRLLNDYGTHTRSGCPTRGVCLEAWVENAIGERV